MQEYIKWPFKVIAKEEDKPYIRVYFRGEERDFSPIEICAMILSNLKQAVEVRLGKQVKNAVITVPASYNMSQQHAIMDAGAIAELTVLQIINQSTAAAIAYSIKEQQEGHNILVFNLGGGTLNVSVVTMGMG